MTIRTARLDQGHRGPVGGFGLRAALAAAGFTDLDPRHDDVVVQLKGSDGELLCATIGHSLWRSGKGKRFAFTDHRGQLANGVRKGLISVDKNGGVTLAIQGQGLDTKRFTPLLEVATRVGNRCSIGSTQSL